MSNSCLTPRAPTLQTYPTQSVEIETCEFMDDWVDKTACGDTGYSKDDGVTVCVNGTKFIARSLSDNNLDEPKAGSAAVPPTWELKTMAQWLFGTGA